MKIKKRTAIIINPKLSLAVTAAAMIIYKVPIVYAASTNLNATLKQNPIIRDLQTIVNFLSAGVGVVVVGVIILGGIQYAAAGDKAEAVSAAKKRIINGLIALVAFLLTFAFLQWLIPGGVF